MLLTALAKGLIYVWW